jgi:cytochrome c-type biogenesis protein CcmH/NrfG
LAEEQFLAATLEEPGNFAASNNLALALVEQGESEKKRRALQYAERNAQTFQQAAEAWSTLGWVYFLNDKIDQAEQALGKAASAGQLSPDTAYYIARVLLKKYGDDRRDRAKDLLDKAVKTKQPFSKQAEAKQLLKDLKG